MTWFDKQARARRRAEQDRSALAASMEEVVAESKLVVDEWYDAYEDQEIVEHVSTSGTAIIPPLLRLQTRPMPAVNTMQTTMPPSSNLSTTGPVEIPRVIAQGQRLAGRSTKVHLQAVRSGSAEEISTERMAIVEKFPLAGQTGSAPKVESARQIWPTPLSPSSVGQTGSIPRVPPPLEGQTGSMSRVEPVGPVRPLSPSVSTSQNRTASSTVPTRNGSAPASSTAGSQQNMRVPGGRGVIKQGQNVITVPNTAITERSVVNVMLAGNPGPVVIQYIALHPRMGFTVHLSAPTTASTPFNYLIWPF
jgi:hypothetical protein